jgi:hypothetical protein
LTIGLDQRYNTEESLVVKTGHTMSHEHTGHLPPIPFSNAEFHTMFEEDKKAAWDIARLTGGIFTFGLFLYTLVLFWAYGASPIYLYR